MFLKVPLEILVGGFFPGPMLGRLQRKAMLPPQTFQHVAHICSVNSQTHRCHDDPQIALMRGGSAGRTDHEPTAMPAAETSSWRRPACLRCRLPTRLASRTRMLRRLPETETLPEFTHRRTFASPPCGRHIHVRFCSTASGHKDTRHRPIPDRPGIGGRPGCRPDSMDCRTAGIERRPRKNRT
jgi:hypothetical protein